MPGKNKYPLLGAHVPDVELQEWVRAEAKRRGVDLVVILTEALGEYRAAREQDAAPDERIST